MELKKKRILDTFSFTRVSSVELTLCSLNEDVSSSRADGSP
jgi:hypothetical protein